MFLRVVGIDIILRCMASEGEKQTIYLPLSRGLIEHCQKQDYEDDPLGNLHKNQTQLQFGQVFEDDAFKLVNLELPKHIVVKRLKDILQIGSSIKECKYIKESECSEILKNKYAVSSPTYLSEIKLIPEWHFQYLIEPETVNGKGYYHVAVVKEGRIIKKTIDDYVYFNEHTRRIHSHPFLEDKPWIHIIVKTWAKMNRGYENIPLARPFQFIKAFTYPDWSVINPSLESLQSILKRFSSSNKKDYIYIGRTKSSEKIGYFGLIPDCASYLISGYYQEYGNIFIRIKSYVGDKWNGVCSEKPVALPMDNIKLGENEFIMPIQQFINVFHLIYLTSNKFNVRSKNFYGKLSLNLDARESKAKLVRIEVGGEGSVESSVNLNIYLPSVNAYDLANKRENYEQKLAIPFCKVLLGRQLEQQNNRESSYADSMREKMLNNEKGDFLALSNHKYEFVRGDYTLGYANEMTYHLKLKAGSYILRLKIEKLLPEYRALLNVTSNVQVKIGQVKAGEGQLVGDFLSEVLSHKARMAERNIIYPTPSNKTTWVMINNDFNLLGYGSILFQMGKHDNRGLTVQINSQKLKEGGYRLKNKEFLIESKYKIYLRERESKILILKEDIEWRKGVRAWVPEGVHMKFDSLPEKLVSARKL